MRSAEGHQRQPIHYAQGNAANEPNATAVGSRDVYRVAGRAVDSEPCVGRLQ